MSKTDDTNTNSAEAQRLRILNRLEISPASTIELRRDLDVMMPAARVHELRHQFGKNITTIWTHQHTESGKLHRVARYVLQSGGAA
jgi:hypothetical protein